MSRYDTIGALILRVLVGSSVPMSSPAIHDCLDGLDDTPRNLTLSEIRGWLQSNHQDVACGEHGGWRIRPTTTIPPTVIPPIAGCNARPVAITAFSGNAALLHTVQDQAKTIRLQAARIADLSQTVKNLNSSLATRSTGNITAPSKPPPPVAPPTPPTPAAMPFCVAEILADLHVRGPSTSCILAEHLGIAVPTLSWRLNHHRALLDSFVERTRDGKDSRRIRWSLRQPLTPNALESIKALVPA